MLMECFPYYFEDDDSKVKPLNLIAESWYVTVPSDVVAFWVPGYSLGGYNVEVYPPMSNCIVPLLSR
jgi:hypothetical protein